MIDPGPHVQAETSTPSDVRSELLEQLATFTQSRLKLDTALQAEVKQRVLDAVGCAIFGARLPHSLALQTALLDDSGSGRYALIGTDRRVGSPILAALLNGAFVSAFELDDAGSYVHPGATIVGTALVAAQLSTSRRIGAEIIDAVAVGYEMAVRISETTGFTSEGIIGWHTPGFHSTIGAAATSARLLGLNHQQTLHSLAMAADLAGGGLMSARFGTDVKRSHTGRAGQTGLTAALMAREGLTGAPDVLENARWGYFRALTYGGEGPDENQIASTVDDIGTHWRAFSAVAYKEYPITAKGIGVINNARAIRKDHGVEPDEITKVTIGMSLMGAGQRANAMPASAPSHVNFSYPYAAAVALSGLAEPLTSAAASPGAWINGYENPEIDRIQRLTEVVWDKSIDDENPYSMNSVVTVSTGRGPFSARVHYGDSENPHALRLSQLTSEGLEQKFLNLAGTSLSRERSAASLELIRNLEALDQLDELLDAIA